MSTIRNGGSGFTGPRQCDDWTVRKIVAEGAMGDESENHCLVALGQITAGMMHDLKNFCGQAQGLQKLAERELKAGDYTRAERHVGMIGLSIEGIIALCENLLQFGSSKCRDFGHVILRNVVDEVLAMAVTMLDGVRVAVCNQCGDVGARISRFQLQQVLLNLIRNAQQSHQREAQQKGNSEISITIHPMRRTADVAMLGNSERKQYIGISVDDNGDGMDEEVLSKIARPFFTTKRTGQGTGLGLFMSAHLAELYEGALIIRTKQGVGTRVTLCLPVAVECS